MRFKLLIVGSLIFCGCQSHPESDVRNPYNTVYHIQLDVTVGKYNLQEECTNNGGTWVVGNTKEWVNAVVGCAEPKQK